MRNVGVLLDLGAVHFDQHGTVDTRSIHVGYQCLNRTGAVGRCEAAQLAGKLLTRQVENVNVYIDFIHLLHPFSKLGIDV